MNPPPQKSFQYLVKCILKGHILSDQVVSLLLFNPDSKSRKVQSFRCPEQMTCLMLAFSSVDVIVRCLGLEIHHLGEFFLGKKFFKYTHGIHKIAKGQIHLAP